MDDGMRVPPGAETFLTKSGKTACASLKIYQTLVIEEPSRVPPRSSGNGQWCR